MRDGLDDVDVGTQALLENVCGVTGGSKADDLQCGALLLDERLQARQHFLGVLNRVALGELVLLLQDVAVLVHEDAFRRG